MFCPFGWEIPIAANFQRGLNYTKLWEKPAGQSSAGQEIIVLDFRYVTRLEERATQRRSKLIIQAKFRTFTPPRKIRGGMGEISE